MIHCPRGLPSARVAPQRCPILLTDDDSISHFFDYFHTTIEIVLDMGYIAECGISLQTLKRIIEKNLSSAELI